jgi:non-reducing end alpha-L-arabinofuranosidase
MKVQSAFLATAIAFAMISGACSSNPGTTSGTGGSSSTGGTPGTGGTVGTGGSSSGTGGGASCPNVAACGGNAVGTWNVMSSCLTVNGSVAASWLGLDPTTCTSVGISGALSVTGSFTVNADGSYKDMTTTTGSPKLDLAPGCLTLSGTKLDCAGLQRSIAGATCTSASSGGCTCALAVNQMGGIGVISAGPSKSDAYTLSGNSITLTTDAGDEKYAYCVAGTKMTWTPQSINLPIMGTIVMTNGASSGTGGSTGTGGATGSGGSTGGSTGSGGHAGATGTGGAAGHGGTTGTGGGGAAGHAGTSGSTGGTTGTGGSGGASARGDGPCDIYAAAGTPCGGAYSTIRALTKTYTGPLYQIRTGSSSMNTGTGGTLKDIPQTADGFADTSVQDPLCSGTTCTVATLYDQSGNGNNLIRGSAGLTNGGAHAGMTDYESSATKGVLMVGGHKVYALYMNQYEGYRTKLNVKATGVSLDNSAQGIYELADGTHSGTACCWDFGSVSPDPTTYVTMNTLFFGTAFWGNGAGSGPWFMGDFEGGVWAGGSKVGDPGWGALNDAHPSNTANPSLKVQFAMGVLHTPVGKYALRMADIKTATDLTTAYDGNIPAGKNAWGNAGGIALGIGGDNSNNSWGTFYEGAMTKGSPSNATDLAVMQNIQAANYGK